MREIDKGEREKIERCKTNYAKNLHNLILLDKGIKPHAVYINTGI